MWSIRYAQKIKFQNQSIFELNLASYDSKTISIEKFSKQEVISCMISLSVHLVPIILTEHVSMMTEQIQTIKNWTKCRMRTLLLVKYRDEPFAKTCIQYPFVATANENNKIRLLSTWPYWNIKSTCTYSLLWASWYIQNQYQKSCTETRFKRSFCFSLLGSIYFLFSLFYGDHKCRKNESTFLAALTITKVQNFHGAKSKYVFNGIEIHRVTYNTIRIVELSKCPNLGNTNF